MGKAKVSGFYAVQTGRKPGIYETWADCEAQVKGWPKAKYQKFRTHEEAQAFVAGQAASTTITSTNNLTTTHSAKPYDRPDANTLTQSSTRTGGDILSGSSAMDEAGWTTVFTDGACRGNGKAGSVAGVGVFWGVKNPKNLSERCPGDQTNNRAELIAIIRALEMTPVEEKLIIKTDSKYVISCIQLWLPQWKEKGFRTKAGGTVANLPLILYLEACLNAKAPGTIRIHHVYGHVGIAGNEHADALAGMGCLKPWREELNDEWDVTKQERRGASSMEPIDVKGIDIQISPDDILSLEELAEMERTQDFN